MNKLRDIETAAAPGAVAQDNFEDLDRDLYGRRPTLVAGVATTTIGPPATGAHVAQELWTDALLGLWLCTAAGSPGTWAQIAPAPVQADPSTGTIPTGYLIVRTDLFGQQRRHAGGYAWLSGPATDSLDLRESGGSLYHTLTLVQVEGIWTLNINQTGHA